MGLALLACSGSLEGPLPGGGLGAPGGDTTVAGGNFADGTLSSQSGYQQLDNGCGFELTLRFSGEGRDVKNWILDGSAFPAVTVGKIVGEIIEKEYSFEACTDCQGRVLRVVDLGVPPGDFHTAQDHFIRMFGWSQSLKFDQWDPALLPAARYRDFAIQEEGGVDLIGQPMVAGHLYYFLVSRRELAPVSGEMTFASMQEFNEMASCAKTSQASPDHDAPFWVARLVHVLEEPPVELKPIPVPHGENSEESSDGSNKVFQAVPIQQSAPLLQVAP